MNRNHILSFLISGLVLWSCSGPQEKDDAVDEQEPCVYTYDEGQTTLEWTAYKYTEKAPVSGTFDEINISSDVEESNDPKELVKSLKFSIPTATVQTDNQLRNENIVNSFFHLFAGDSIIGRVKSLSDNGKMTIELDMNGVKHDVSGSYELDGTRFSYSATINLHQWNAGKAITSLNTACKDVHTGKDGISKLWPDIALIFTTELLSDCE